MDTTKTAAPYTVCDHCGRLFVTLGSSPAAADDGCPDCELPLRSLSQQEGRRRLLGVPRALRHNGPDREDHRWN